MNAGSRRLMFEKDTENQQLQTDNEKLKSQTQELQSDKSMLSSNFSTALGIADKAASAAKDAAAGCLVSAQSAHLLATNAVNGGSAPVATGMWLWFDACCARVLSLSTPHFSLVCADVLFSAQVPRPRSAMRRRKSTTAVPRFRPAATAAPSCTKNGFPVR